MAAECEAGLPPFSGIPPVCVFPDGTRAALSQQSTCISTYPCIPLPASHGICTPQPSDGLRGTDPGHKHSDLVLLPIKGQALQMSVACGRLPSQLSTSPCRFPLCGHVMASAIPSQKWQSKCMCHQDDGLEQAASLNGAAWRDLFLTSPGARRRPSESQHQRNSQRVKVNPLEQKAKQGASLSSNKTRRHSQNPKKSTASQGQPS